MKLIFGIAIAYAVLFFLLRREDVDVGENLMAFGDLIGWLLLGVFVVNKIFGTDFDVGTVVKVWITLFGVWTIAAIVFLIDAWRKRRVRQVLWRSIRNDDIC